MTELLDFSVAASGDIGKGKWFSDLYRAAVAASFTGGILVSGAGDRAVFFEGGKPVHAAGPGYTRHFLGEVLTGKKVITGVKLQDAVAKQASMDPRPLLGSLLVSDAGVDPKDIKHAVRDQTMARILELFELVEGTWKSAPGKDARIASIGVAAEPWPILLLGLQHAPVEELRAASDRLLGKAVRLSMDPRKLDRFALDGASHKVIRYLDKPRKPDQLERALENRKAVRALLRLLEIEGGLDLVPAAKAIPIPKASLVKSGPVAIPTSSPPPPEPEPAPDPEPSPAVPAPRGASNAGGLPPIAEEAKAFHATMKERNHFELFGIPQKDTIDAAALRKSYTVLAKKFHPDSFPADLGEEISTIAREVSAHINDAYETLSDDENRAYYLALLSDDRIKGDSRKAELIRDAETKAQMGVVMLRKKDFQKAREFFKYAMEGDPTSGKHKTNFAWAMFADPEFDRQKALTKGYELILEALKAKDLDAHTHFVAGQLLKAQDKMREAEHHFRAALRLDRKHADAQREVRLIEMRAEKAGDDPKSKGGLSKLFKR
jgi:molecular chaperone HscB